MLVLGAGAAWSRPFLPGAGAAFFCLEPESAPGPRTSGAGTALKKGRLRNTDFNSRRRHEIQTSKRYQ